MLTAYAGSTCKEVRLDNDDGPFSKIPVYDQEKFESNDPGICYSIAASHLIDADRYYRGERDLKQITSPLSIAINYNVGRKQSLFAGEGATNRLSLGDTDEAILKNQNKIVCDQRFLEKFISYFSEEKDTNPLVSSDKKKSQENFIKETIAQINTLAAQKERLSNAQTNIANREDCLNSYFQSLIVPNVKNLNDIRQVLVAAVDESDLVVRLKTVLGSICSENKFSVQTAVPINFDGATKEENEEWEKLWNRLVREPSKVKENHKKLDEMTTTMDKLKPQRIAATLGQIFSSEKPVPVAVSFRYSMLSTTGNGSHVATIIGREFNSKTRQCEYIVRDSYGKGCRDNYKFKCVDGNISVPEDVLVNHATNLVWLPR